MNEIYCQGTKKNGAPCKRYLGKVEGKAELLCPICKTLNVVEDGKVYIGGK
jgi:phage FluMu protein Com